MTVTRYNFVNPEDKSGELPATTKRAGRQADEPEANEAVLSYGHPVGDEDGFEAEEESDDSVIADIRDPYNPAQIKIDSDRISIRSIIDRLEHKEITVPDFQREEVWNDNKKSLLIESLIVRIPLPAFYMDATEGPDKWTVIDGLQRISALRDFFIRKTLKLKGLEYLEEIEGNDYHAVKKTRESWLRRINEAQVVVNIVRPGTPSEVKFDIFKRINTGGVILSAQEIRHALYQGKATKLLKELVEWDFFAKVMGTGLDKRVNLDKRMKARECVLRFFAFADLDLDSGRYKTMEGLLNDTMQAINKMQDAEIEKHRRHFKRAMKAAHEIFGDGAFRKNPGTRQKQRSPINVALFEACMVTIDRLNDDQLRKLRQDNGIGARASLQTLVADQDFSKAITASTANTKNIRTRFTMYKAMIEKLLEPQPND